ncbi:MAG: tetratricopeptide repeat protein [Polyangiaceae bacterium]
MFRSSIKLASVLSLLAATAAAQPTPEPSPEAKDKLNQQALAAIRKGDFATAEAILITQWGIEKSARVACNLGQVYYQQKRWPQASQFLDRCVELAGSKVKASAKKAAADAKSKVYRVTIATTPADAEVRIDGEVQSERDLYLSPGMHELVVSADGFENEKGLLDGTAGTQDSRSISLKKIAKVTPAHSATQKPSTAPTPPETPSTPPDQAPDYTVRNVVVIGTAALAVGSLIGHFVFRSSAGSKMDQWNSLGGNDACNDPLSAKCRESKQLVDEWDSARSTGNVLLGAGIGLGVVSVAAFLLWPEPEQSNTSLFPVVSVGSQGGSFVWKGSF